MRLLLPITLIITALLAAASLHAADSRELESVVKPFFAEHCNSCHGAKKQKGDLRTDTLKLDFDSPKTMAHWEEIMNRINSGDMPPDDEPRPKPADVARVAEWIVGQLREAEVALQNSGRERVSFRKLTREEYGNTVRDLLGVNFDVTAPTGLPEDPDWHGFERIGSVLTLSPAHVEKYLAAAEAVLDEALSIRPEPQREVVTWTPFDMRAKGLKKELDLRGIGDQVRHNHSNHNVDPLMLERRAKSSEIIMQQCEHFLDELREIKDGDEPLLDRTMILFGCDKPKDNKARLSNVFVTMLQKMEVNADQFVDSLGPVSEIL